MSIYGSGRGGWKDLNDVVQPIAGAQASGGVQAADDEARWSEVRKARPAEHLLPLTVKWIEGFPDQSKPSALARDYPRICNLIASQWNDHRGAPRLFEDLLTDRRGGRAGFPPAVKRELAMVQAYWYTGALKL